ncbi:hypothetical protein [Paenibacillus polymyxa]|nr:hypothetical protein [Paenibacillus polymyxa]
MARSQVKQAWLYSAGLTKMPYLGLIVAYRKYYSSSSFALRENYAEH